MKSERGTATDTMSVDRALVLLPRRASTRGERQASAVVGGAAADVAPWKVILFANTDWYLFNFRLSLALDLKRRGADVLLISPPGAYCERFASLGLRWTALPFERRSLNPLAQARAIAGLARIYRAEKPDVVHHFTIKCAVYGSIAARWAGVPVIVNALAGLGSAGGHTPSGSQQIARVLAFGSLRFALRNTRVIVQNPDDRALLIRHKIVDPGTCELIRGSGVDLTRFQPTPKSTSGITVLLASRLLWSKGIAEFVQAAETVRSRYPHVRFALAGDMDPGNPETLEPGDLERLERHSKVDVMGHVGDMAALLAKTDVVVLPTSYGEGVPRILVEAAACGLPLIATDAPGCREIVRPGANGFLVGAHDVDALVAAIERLAVDAELRAAMGAESRRIAATEFGEDIVLGGDHSRLSACVLAPMPASGRRSPATGSHLRRLRVEGRAQGRGVTTLVHHRASAARHDRVVVVGRRQALAWTRGLSLAAVGWGALAFGGVYPWAYWPLAAGVCRGRPARSSSDSKRTTRGPCDRRRSPLRCSGAPSCCS